MKVSPDSRKSGLIILRASAPSAIESKPIRYKPLNNKASSDLESRSPPGKTPIKKKFRSSLNLHQIFTLVTYLEIINR
jgi:hypothetical protein